MPKKNKNGKGIMKSDYGRILFVEDEKYMVTLYQAFLEKHGYDFLSTDDIEEAIKIAEFEKPDLILLDLIIPKKEKGIIKMDAEQGYEFLKKAKKNPKIKNIPIVVFTSLDTQKDRQRTKNLGAIDYIYKGKALPQDVLEKVKKYIKKK